MDVQGHREEKRASEGTSLRSQHGTYPVYYRQNEAERDADGRGALGGDLVLTCMRYNTGRGVITCQTITGRGGLEGGGKVSFARESCGSSGPLECGMGVTGHL